MSSTTECTTGCQCTGPKEGERFFYCARHGIRKTKAWHQLCQRRENYFRAWEAGRGPGHVADNKQPVRKAVPRAGPGTELEALLASMRVGAKTGCGCAAKARQMDRWGVAGCEAHFDTIVEWLRSTAAKYGWRDRLRAAVTLAARDPRLAVRLDPRDPLPGLVAEAIARAQEKAR